MVIFAQKSWPQALWAWACLVDRWATWVGSKAVIQPKWQFLWIFPLKLVGFPRENHFSFFPGKDLEGRAWPIGFWELSREGTKWSYYCKCRISPHAVFRQVSACLLQMYLISWNPEPVWVHFSKESSSGSLEWETSVHLDAREGGLSTSPPLLPPVPHPISRGTWASHSELLSSGSGYDQLMCRLSPLRLGIHLSRLCQVVYHLPIHSPSSQTLWTSLDSCTLCSHRWMPLKKSLYCYCSGLLEDVEINVFHLQCLYGNRNLSWDIYIIINPLMIDNNNYCPSLKLLKCFVGAVS